MQQKIFFWFRHRFLNHFNIIVLRNTNIHESTSSRQIIEYPWLVFFFFFQTICVQFTERPNSNHIKPTKDVKQFHKYFGTEVLSSSSPTMNTLTASSCSYPPSFFLNIKSHYKRVNSSWFLIMITLISPRDHSDLKPLLQ